MTLAKRCSARYWPARASIERLPTNVPWDTIGFGSVLWRQQAVYRVRIAFIAYYYYIGDRIAFTTSVERRVDNPILKYLILPNATLLFSVRDIVASNSALF
jgi:hypothetical protein